MMSAVLSLCAGFLLAVLWFDLMFDVQVLGRGGPGQPLPEEVLGSIAAYYRRVTTEARPMNYLVAFVMVVATGGTLIQLLQGGGPLAPRAGALVLCGLPITAAGTRTVPNAARLGARVDPTHVQSRLARAICRDHLVFFSMIAAFALMQLLGL
jgi:hypothetical protein